MKLSPSTCVFARNATAAAVAMRRSSRRRCRPTAALLRCMARCCVQSPAAVGLILPRYGVINPCLGAHVYPHRYAGLPWGFVTSPTHPVSDLSAPMGCMPRKPLARSRQPTWRAQWRAPGASGGNPSPRSRRPLRATNQAGLASGLSPPADPRQSAVRNHFCHRVNHRIPRITRAPFRSAALIVGIERAHGRVAVETLRQFSRLDRRTRMVPCLASLFIERWTPTYRKGG